MAWCTGESTDDLKVEGKACEMGDEGEMVRSMVQMPVRVVRRLRAFGVNCACWVHGVLAGHVV